MNTSQATSFVEKQLPVDANHLLNARKIILPTVTVMNGGLKVNDRVYSLNGVTEVRPETVFKRISVFTKVWQIVCWLIVVTMLLGMIYEWISSTEGLRIERTLTLKEVFSVYCIFILPWVFAFRMGNLDKIDRYHRASVILMRGKQMQRIVIGAFRPAPNGDVERRMLNMGYRPAAIERWKAEYSSGVARANAIVEAVGNAIGQRA